MKKTIYILAALAASLTVSCAKDSVQDVPGAGGFLSITADCAGVTKTDISGGKTSWEAGDRITVVYDGKAYTYVTSVAGATAEFTSEAGISGYDSAKGLVAYYPETDASGVISLPAKRQLKLDGNQSNTSCSPLVGTPVDKGFDGSSLKVSFVNVFSTLELVIDGGSIADKAQSLTISPEGEFSGYLTAEGTVDPSTLEFTTSATGSELVLELDGADLTKQLDIKVPVGRFTASEGLKVTVTTVDGSSYARYIYKTGISTFGTVNGKYTFTHFSKPMYAFSKPGSIKSMDDFREFVAAVNSGAGTAAWENADGVTLLETDLDFSGVTEWTPIGNAVANWASNMLTVSGNPYTGRFDGGNHTIRNLKMVCRSSTAGTGFGFFGVASGAEISNLVFDSSCSLESQPSEIADCGVAVGVLNDSKLSNIVNNAAMTYSGTCSARSTLGIVGFAFAGKGAVISDCVNNGVVTAEAGANTKNGATAIQVAGICGFSTNANGSTNAVLISGCTNNADIESTCARASGITAAANRYTVITGCVNKGKNTSSFVTSGGGRLGNITCITGPGVQIIRTKNYGDLISTTSAVAGGIVCLVNDNSCVFEDVENYGAVVTDKTGSYVGTFFGQCNKSARFTSCVSAGKLGTYNKGDIQYVDINADNYFDYIGSHSNAATGVSKDTIRYTAE